MTTTNGVTKEDALVALTAERDQWLRLVEAVGPGRIETPGAMGEWTFKDVAAHLAGWDERRAAALEAMAAGDPQRPVKMPWPSNIDDDEVANDWIYATNKDRSASDVLADASRQYDRMLTAMAAAPEEMLNDQALDPWRLGESFASRLIEGSLFEHLHEHDEEVRAWLTSLD